MNSTEETKANCTREIEVEIPAAVVAGETETLVQRYQKLARIPGFRKGKAPATIVRHKFADDLKSEVVEKLVPRYFQEETKKQGLSPVSQPRVTDLHVADGEPLRFKATFEVLPEFQVSEYKDLATEPQEIKIADEEVDAEVNKIREQQATFTPVEDRALQDGDFAQVSFTGQPKQAEGEEAAKPIKVDEVLVEIGGTNTVKEFTENLRGAKPGDEKTFEVNYPADFSDQRLAGKTFTYTASIKAVKQKSLPELDDDFAKQLGEFDTLDALKTRIREAMEAEKKHQAEHEAKDKIVDELVKRNDFPVPESLVERQIDLRLERGLRALAAQGVRPEHLKQMDFGRLRTAQREGAVKEVKVSLILDRISETEKIEATDEEVNKEIEALALQAKQPVEELRERLTHEGVVDRIRDRIRSEKTLDFLYHRPA